jgi:hypothetical protein
MNIKLVLSLRERRNPGKSLNSPTKYFPPFFSDFSPRDVFDIWRERIFFCQKSGLKKRDTHFGGIQFSNFENHMTHILFDKNLQRF